MGGMSLSGFGTTAKSPPPPTPSNPPEDTAAPEASQTSEDAQPTDSPSQGSKAPKRGKAGARSKKSKQVTVNIKILKQQQDWLRDTAQTVRDNNDEAVPASDRVYPQHLIQVAIDMLQGADVDWEQVRNAEELRQQLKL